MVLSTHYKMCSNICTSGANPHYKVCALQVPNSQTMYQWLALQRKWSIDKNLNGYCTYSDHTFIHHFSGCFQLIKGLYKTHHNAFGDRHTTMLMKAFDRFKMKSGPAMIKTLAGAMIVILVSKMIYAVYMHVYRVVQ